MQKGFLKLIILKRLLERNQTGSDLMDALKESWGKRPSPGTIYPLLQDLTLKGYIDFKENGRKKEYSITKAGKKRIDTLIAEKESVLAQNIQLVKSVGDLADNEEIKEAADFFDMVAKKPIEALDLLPILHEYKKQVIRLSKEGKKTKLKEILKKHISELKRVH